MRFQVPQFIDVEDKIFGPLTLKQFIYLAGGAGLSFLIYTRLEGLLPFAILVIIMAPVLVFSLVLAFYRINNKPFIFILESAVKYYMSPKLYLWKKNPRNPEAMVKNPEAAEAAQLLVPKISNSKLKDMTWSLDIKESIYSNMNQK
jgi:hypothetical protein